MTRQRWATMDPIGGVEVDWSPKTSSASKCSLTRTGYKALPAQYLDGRLVTAESGMMSGCQQRPDQ